MDKKTEKIVLIEEEENIEEVDENRDPITGEPGAHPIGVAAGGTSGASAGAAIGTVVGGPVGGIIGAAAGAVAGGLAGKGVAETVNPTEEEDLEFDENQFFDKVRANWNHFKQAVIAKWDRLTDADIDATTGRREQIVNKIQERYPEIPLQKDQIRQELSHLSRHC